MTQTMSRRVKIEILFRTRLLNQLRQPQRAGLLTRVPDVILPTMSTLAEIEAAVEQLPLPQQETLFAFLAQRLRHTNGSGAPAKDRDVQLLDLAAHAEPMGALTNAEIDQAVSGR